MRITLFLLGGMLMTMSATAAGQTAAAPTALATSFETVAGYLVAAAEQVTEDRYGFRPTEGVRTFLQLVAHVADGNDYYCRHAVGDRIDWSDPVERSATGRAGAIDALRSSIERCRAAYARPGADPAALTENVAHANLHYGNMIVYLRMMGLVPPSS
jgi:hypothetical protein